MNTFRLGLSEERDGKAESGQQEVSEYLLIPVRGAVSKVVTMLVEEMCLVHHFVWNGRTTYKCRSDY